MLTFFRKLMESKKFRYATIKVVHSALNTEQTIDYDTNTKYSKIVGIRIVGTTTANFSGGLKVNGEELFPEGHSFSLLVTDLTVSPDERFLTVDLPAKGSKITGKTTVTSGTLTQKIELKYEV